MTPGGDPSGAASTGPAADDDPVQDAGAPDGRPCPACDEPMHRRHCKYVCPSHGVVYDCSDTFW